MLKLFKKINKTLDAENMSLAIITEDMIIETCNIEFSIGDYKLTVSEGIGDKFSIFRFNTIEHSTQGIENVSANEIMSIILDTMIDERIV
jgi:hypothetical protein